MGAVVKESGMLTDRTIEIIEKYRAASSAQEYSCYWAFLIWLTSAVTISNFKLFNVLTAFTQHIDN